MNRNQLLTAAVIIMGIFAYFWFEDSSTVPAIVSQDRAVLEQVTDLIVADQSIYDLNGRLAYKGDIDLRPALERIARGERDPHDNDGSVFANREALLPKKERGYYREYVLRTPGISHAGPQRIILGEAGEIYYTADHYKSFVRLK